MKEIQIENSIQCPYCHGYARRIRRRKIDRWISLIRPIARFECQNHICQWIGNVYHNELADKKNSTKKVVEKSFTTI